MQADALLKRTEAVINADLKQQGQLTTCQLREREKVIQSICVSVLFIRGMEYSALPESVVGII